ncbi:MAG: hypothetical protein NC084_12575 [Bacteroides sp.]|nr:hypothetical protein [Eubacterium sp.]MCM1417712.1 hypothetical protein [Roseburia sp.]MCM1463528.1 hypothetical protein [Bacteroides sp.]
MANLSTYAKLIKPKQFRFDESATFRVEFSENLLCTYATLKFYGSRALNSDTIYFTQYVNMSWLGTGYVEFTVPPNSLIYIPEDAPTHPAGGTVRAVVEFGVETDENGNAIPQFTSNEIAVDILVNWKGDFGITDTPLTASGSTKKIKIKYVQRDSVGASDATDVNSYRVALYDTEYNLIQESGAMYDWTKSYLYREYTLTGLEDRTEYLVRVQVTLNGGYVFDSGYLSLSVKYAEESILSPNLLVENEPTKGRIKLRVQTDISYDRAVVSRTVLDADDYIQLKEYSRRGFTYYDYYALPNVTYSYRVVLYSGDTIVATYYQRLTHRISGICIADQYGGYHAMAFTKKYPVNKNDRAAIVEPMDSKYPYAVINGNLDYDSGSISATFAPLGDCMPDFSNNAGYSQRVRHWLNNGEAKLLKYYNGECWLVSVSGITTEQEGDSDVLSTTFNWTQIADATQNENYIKLGMMNNEST